LIVGRSLCHLSRANFPLAGGDGPFAHVDSLFAQTHGIFPGRGQFLTAWNGRFIVHDSAFPVRDPKRRIDYF